MCPGIMIVEFCSVRGVYNCDVRFSGLGDGLVFGRQRAAGLEVALVSTRRGVRISFREVSVAAARM